MFVKHCKVEIYYTEFLLAENSNPQLTVKKKFSKSDTLGKLLGHGSLEPVGTVPTVRYRTYSNTVGKATRICEKVRYLPVPYRHR